jgi:hypothetical protein
MSAYITIDELATLRGVDGAPPCSDGLERARAWLTAHGGRVEVTVETLASASAAGVPVVWWSRVAASEHHAALVADRSWRVRAAMARRTDLAVEHHAVLVRDHDADVRAAMADRADLAVEHHAALVDDANWLVRCIMARRLDLASDHQDALWDDDDADVRAAMADQADRAAGGAA